MRPLLWAQMGFPLVKANLVVALMKDSLPDPASQEVPRV